MNRWCVLENQNMNISCACACVCVYARAHVRVCVCVWVRESNGISARSHKCPHWGQFDQQAPARSVTLWLHAHEYMYSLSCTSNHLLGSQPSDERATFASAIAIASGPFHLVLSVLVLVWFLSFLTCKPSFLTIMEVRLRPSFYSLDLRWKGIRAFDVAMQLDVNNLYSFLSR